jgi:hypothetical protein
MCEDLPSGLNCGIAVYMNYQQHFEYLCVFEGVWRDAMIRLEEYAEKFKSINVIVGPIFDYNYDGLDDTFLQISK